MANLASALRLRRLTVLGIQRVEGERVHDLVREYEQDLMLFQHVNLRHHLAVQYALRLVGGVPGFAVRNVYAKISAQHQFPCTI